MRLATRGSRLALAQTALVSEALHQATGMSVETVVLTTRGDDQQTTPAAEMEGQGWFTGELERCLREGGADGAVHSAKDLPTEPAAGLLIAALLRRGDARDVAVTGEGCLLAELARGATVGTSSPRRHAFIAELFPALRVVPMRGNVDTRLAKLEAGEVASVILAGAGLDRLGMTHRITEWLDPHEFIPAPAQGAIALQVPVGSWAAAACVTLNDAATAAAVAAERSALRALGGGCLLPLGAWARVEGGALTITAGLATETGMRTAELSGDPADPEALGVAVAAQLQ
ncbi:MAG: hydroxymethylbilane synthase [Candidatus Dormibacteria bacterium]